VRTSRLPSLHRDTVEARRRRLVESRWLAASDAAALAEGGGLDEAIADSMIENVIGIHALPLAVATNFRINGRDVLVPMSIEEPSIVAACSYAARMVYGSGGFQVECDPPLLACQIQLFEPSDMRRATEILQAARAEILSRADEVIPHMVKRGGGARALELRVLSADLLVVHVLIDCRDAMGANLVNSVAEALAPTLCALTGARAGLRILTNLTDQRKVYVRARVPCTELATPDYPDGVDVAQRIVEAQRFAELDVYRAATHNKGIMNGVDAVLLACGNDFRAVEAGAHAYACRAGRYSPLTSWSVEEGGQALQGELVMPLSTSCVGGAAHNHPGVLRALRLAGVTRGTDVASMAGAAGLASNLAALRALSTEGIQRGHMSLHARRIAAEAGAEGLLLDEVATRLTVEKVFRLERAREVLEELRRERLSAFG
jgi:hydroxymethylglutaryl-CoA reductase